DKFNHFTCLLQVKRDRGVGRGVEVETSTMPGIHIIDSHLMILGTPVGGKGTYKITDFLPFSPLDDHGILGDSLPVEFPGGRI
ncbi:MAG TPA: hypothetical protein VIJ93_06795, partial [bacterium]